MHSPKCAKCGNDGSESAIYLTVDARWMPEEGAWKLVQRDDTGGASWDCLACDHITPVYDDTGKLALFPYGLLVRPPA